MDSFLVSHTQYPVGQGGLHLCQLVSCPPGPQPLVNILYDCGSSRGKRALAPALRCVASRLDPFSKGRSNLSLLILSHLHHDHVNGWELLFKKDVTADRLIIPHYDDDDKLLLLAKLAAAGATASQLRLMAEVVQNPARWFGERGVDQVIAVRAAEGGTEPPPQLPEAGPPDGYEVLPRRERRPSTEGGEAGLGLELYVPAGSAVRKADLVLVPNRTLVCAIASRQRNLSWVVLPYCQKVVPGQQGHQNRAAFVTAIRNILQPYLQNNSLALGNGAPSVLTALKTIWKNYVGSQHATWNILSISAYLGFTDQKHLSVCEAPWRLLVLPTFPLWDLIPDCKHFARLKASAPAGWLLTGDSNLAKPKYFRPWKRFFALVRRLPVIFQGPHHGAAKNVSPIALPSRPVAVFVTCASKDPKHPAPSFIASIRKSPLFCVTEDPSSQLTTAVLVDLP